MNLFATGESSQCPLFFSLHDRRDHLGVDALAHQFYCMHSPNSSDFSDPSRGAGGWTVDDSHCSLLAVEALACRDNSAPVPGAVANTQGPALSGARGNI